MRFVTAIMALLAFITIHTARADSIASQFPVGSTYEGTIQVVRTQVPLPPGKWTVTSLEETRSRLNNALTSITMANILNGKLMGYVVVATNIDAGRSGWESHKLCSRKDVYFLQVDADYQKEQACWGVNHTIMDPTSTYKPTYGKNIRQSLADHGIGMPRLLVSTLFRFANEHSFLTYEILLNPEYFGFSSAGESTWASSPWHKDLIAQKPKRQQFLEQMKAQYAAFYPMLKTQFR